MVNEEVDILYNYTMNKLLKSYILKFHKFNHIFLIINLFLISMLVGVFFLILEGINEQDIIYKFDTGIISFIVSHRTNFLSNFFLAFTQLGGIKVIVILTILISFGFIIKHKWSYLVLVLSDLAFGSLLVIIIKNIVHRARPPFVDAIAFESSYSFPSAHSFISMTFYGLIVYLLIRKTKDLLLRILILISGILLILLIGISRIYLGVHWTSDVMAGYISGIVWLILVIWMYEWILKRNLKTQDPGGIQKKGCELGNS